MSRINAEFFLKKQSFPKDIDVFAQMVGSRNTSIRRRVFLK